MILRNLLYFISILLVIGWALGYFVWPHQGSVIHTLAGLAVLSFILSIYVGMKSKRSGNDI
jgi:hypothetical protein